MRILLVVLWLLIPVGAFAYHLGPGQGEMKRDQVSQILQEADGFVQAEQWALAAPLFKQAIELLPENEVVAQRRARLELAKCQVNDRGLSEATESLKVLVKELMDDETAGPELLADARTALANSQYYITWLMRLEGRPQEDWQPEIDSSQQIYRLLAEQADDDGDLELISIRKSDLESSVQLARMDIGDLQGLPLPSQ